ncbi:MAG: excalibur calcium-binding domain-containing protein [Dehalococcoidia bacterium]|nr:excalibur calcium-binding domain-containing protein [Dehalococcoidia bacterium]
MNGEPRKDYGAFDNFMRWLGRTIARMSKRWWRVSPRWRIETTAIAVLVPLIAAASACGGESSSSPASRDEDTSSGVTPTALASASSTATSAIQGFLGTPAASSPATASGVATVAATATTVPSATQVPATATKMPPTPVPPTPIPPTPIPPTATATATSAPSVYYPNCAAVRAAGKAPLYRGDPGYRSGLDRDNDGIACDTVGN